MYISSDLWCIILKYTNDPYTCKNLYESLPDYTKTSLKKVYEKQYLLLSVTLLYTNSNSVCMYSNGRILNNIINTERLIKTVRFSGENEFCVCTINGEITYWDVNTFKTIRKFKCPQSYIDLLEIHPDGTKLITKYGHHLKLWNSSGNHFILNSEMIYSQITSMFFHPILPYVYMTKIVNNRLLELHRWNYVNSIIDKIALQIEDNYAIAEGLLDPIVTEMLSSPIKFSDCGNYIEGTCFGHIKSILLNDRIERCLFTKTNKKNISDFIWNKNRTILYYSYYNPTTNRSCISNNDVLLYDSTFTISRLLRLVCDETVLLFIQENSVYSMNLENLVVSSLLEYNSTCRIEYL
jgi:hypothetical protein